MVSPAADEVVTNKTVRLETESEQIQPRGRRRQRPEEENGNEIVRYFLSKAESNGGNPSIEKEIATEGEALVESLRHGVTFYAVQEFPAIADLSGRRPQLAKEPVTAEKN